MPQTVDFDGLGTIEFPDEMSKEAIADVLKTQGDSIRARFSPATSAGIPADPTPAKMIPDLPELPKDTLLQPYNYVPQQDGSGPLEVGTFDEAKKGNLR